MSKRSAAWAFALAAAVALGIAYFSFDKDKPGKPRFPLEDKVKHAFAYGVLAWTGARAFGRIGPRPRAAAGVAFVVAAAYGAAIEVVQPVFGRSGEVADEVANALGAALGAVGWLRLASGGLVAGAGPAATSLALLALALPACAAAPPPALPTAEDRIREQAAHQRSQDADLAPEAYAIVEATVPAPERPFYRWLRIRLEPERGARRLRLEELLVESPDLAPALIEAGDLAFEAGDHAAARARWTAARAREPASPRPLARLAWLDRSPDLARAAIAAAKEVERPLAEGFLAGAHLLAGDAAAARSVLAAAADQGTADPIAWMIGGAERLAAGSPVEASRLFERALLRAPRELVPFEDYLRATTARLDALLAAGLDLEARELAIAAAERWPGVEPFRRVAERRRTWRVP